MELRNRLMRAAWPAFLAACVLELMVFAVVDPQDLRDFGPLAQMSRQGVYTLAFFAFWLVSLGACGLALMLDATPSRPPRAGASDGR
jgi:hypothetical protein